MSYQIKYYYQTGDSFGSKDAEGILELEWNDLNVAKANLKRIQAHYQMNKEIERKGWEIRTKRLQGTRESLREVYEKEDWFVKDNDYNISENCIILYTDAGKPYQLWCPWCGYFECLYGVKIISKTPEESDMEFYV